MTEMKSKRKPLSFSTTMRNPDRIAGFLSQLKPYENQVLTSENIFNIIRGVIKNKLYKTKYEMHNEKYKKIYFSDSLTFSDSDVSDIINNSPQNHKEAGFDYGWESRFQTWYSLPQEFGFVFYNKNEKLEISETGNLLIEAFKQESPNEELIQNIFLNSMIKYKTDNPFKKNSNSNNPLLLLLKTIQLLKNDSDENNAGIYKDELSLLICWNNDDATEVYNKIKELRDKYGYKYTAEIIYDECLKILGYNTEKEKDSVKKYYKINKICGEAIDEYIRKMRSTGIISLRGNGRFLDINSFESKKIDYVLKNYSSNQIFKSKRDYYSYIGKFDSNILKIHNIIEHDKEYNIKIDTLYQFANNYDREEIIEELIILSKKKESKNVTFKFIPAPTRLEFLTSISLAQNLTNCIVEPNYSIDDEGLPTMTAKGEMPDIVCNSPDEFIISNIEVTMMCGRSDQINNEIIPIRRHLMSKNTDANDKFAVFIAPVIHEDTKESSSWYKHKDNINIYTYSIEEFTELIKKISRISELQNYEII